MNIIPERGSTGCVLILASILFGFIGVVLTIGSVGGLIKSDGELFTNVSLLGVGVILVVGAVIAFKSATASTAPEILFPVDLEDTDKTSEIVNRLSPAEREVLDSVKKSILAIPSPDELALTLREKYDGRLTLANPLVQPIAFAMKPTPAQGYVKGVVMEVFIWAGAFISIPFLMVWGVYVYDFWKTGQAVLYQVLRWSRRAKRYRARTHIVFQRDNRAPVLYLRSFAEDYEEDLEYYFATTAEELLARSYNRYGPVIAIGRPKEKLPLLGASRIYFDDETWQAGVLHLMSVSQLVVLQAGFAPGLFWELGVARQRVNPEKLIISFGVWDELDERQRHLSYMRFKKYAEPLLGCTLPPDIKATGQITFEAGWVPKPLPKVFLSTESKVKRENIRRLIVGGLGGGIAVILGLYVVPALVKTAGEKFNKPPIYIDSNAHWSKQSIALTGMSVDLPGKLEPIDKPPFMWPVQELSMYRYDGGDLIIDKMGRMLFFSLSLPDGEATLKVNADSIWETENVSKLSYLTTKVAENTFTLDGQFIKDKKDYILRGYSSVKGHNLWLMIVYYDSANNDASSAAQRIFDSIKISD